MQTLVEDTVQRFEEDSAKQAEDTVQEWELDTVQLVQRDR